MLHSILQHFVFCYEYTNNLVLELTIPTKQIISCWKVFFHPSTGKPLPPHRTIFRSGLMQEGVPSHLIRICSRESPIARVVQIWLPISTGCLLAHPVSSAELRIPQPAKSPSSLPTAHPQPLAVWFETGPCVVDINLIKDRASLLGFSFGTGFGRADSDVGHQVLMFFSCDWDALVGFSCGHQLDALCSFCRVAIFSCGHQLDARPFSAPPPPHFPFRFSIWLWIPT